MDYEEKLLKLLVENYRKSRKDSGANKINRRTRIKPEKLYPGYSANDGDFQKIDKINCMVAQLVRKGYVTIETESFGTQLLYIYLVDEKISEIESFLLEQYGYVSKDMQLGKMQKLVEAYRDMSPVCREECERLERMIAERKIPANMDEIADVLKAVAFIENNREQLYLREVSMKVYGDSKYFENVTLQTVCSTLRKYSGKTDGGLIDEILLDYNIAREPQKLCIKGNVILDVAGKKIDISGFSEGIEFLAADMVNIQDIKLFAGRFMTIENRTSYLRYKEKDTVTFYLGGYANRFQRDFIKKVYDTNKDIDYLHFGDIDAGGFWIHHNLCEITGVNFRLFGMSVRELQMEENAGCLHRLTEIDRERLLELEKKTLYADVVKYMLAHDVKLEQEIVSLGLMG